MFIVNTIKLLEHLRVRVQYY